MSVDKLQLLVKLLARNHSMFSASSTTKWLWAELFSASKQWNGHASVESMEVAWP
jgi:hypothetical protein